MKALHLGMAGPAEDFAVATAFKVFTAGSSYFHEGVSLQECLVPVVTLTPHVAASPRGPTHVTVTYRHEQFTQRIFIVKLKLATLDAPELDVNVFAVAAGAARPVGQAADCEARDPATGLIRLKTGMEEAVAILIDDDFQGKQVEIRVFDASGSGVVLGSLTLKNACMD